MMNGWTCTRSTSIVTRSGASSAGPGRVVLMEPESGDGSETSTKKKAAQPSSQRSRHQTTQAPTRSSTPYAARMSPT